METKTNNSVLVTIHNPLNKTNVCTCPTSPHPWPHPGSFTVTSAALCITDGLTADSPLPMEVASALAQKPFQQLLSPVHTLTPSSLSEFLLHQSFEYNKVCHVFAYKKVANKVRPVATTMPAHAHIVHQIPEDPLLLLPFLPASPPDFVPGKCLTQERMDNLGIFKMTFSGLKNRNSQHKS
jgi:hypothetical protein